MNSGNFRKILFINPPGQFKSPALPLGLASIAAYLKEKNKDVEIAALDAWAENLSFEEIENRAAQTNADIVGVYMTSPRYDETKGTLRAARQALPDAVIIVGGPHPSAVPAETLKELPQIDICVIGEGEITMSELVRAFQNHSRVSDIDGIAYRLGQEIRITKPRGFIKNLDELPLPARELFPIEKYKAQPPFGRKNPWLVMVTSRGCPFQCAFCSKSVFFDSFRARSPKKVCDEMEELINKYHAREIYFADDDFTMDMKRAEEICDEILRRGIKIPWFCFTRVNLVNENLLRKMKEAGCWVIAYGVESGNQKILDAIHKGTKVEETISAFKMTKQAGIATICSFMVGLPGETKETIQDTVNLVKKIKPDFIGCGVLIVYPGSRLFKLIQSGQYQGQLRVLDKLNKKDDLGGVFSGQGNYTTFESNLTLQELRKALKKARREFYLRPQYLWQSLKNIRSFSDLRCYVGGAAVIIKSTMKK